MPICDKDCFNCPYPDCINDAMDADDYAEARGRDKLLNCPARQGRRPDYSVDEQRRKQMDRRNARSRARYAENREAILAKAKARREADPELAARQKAYRLAYYQANRAAIAERQKAYYQEHREERTALYRAYYAANREEINAKARERYRRKQEANNDM